MTTRTSATRFCAMQFALVATLTACTEGAVEAPFEDALSEASTDVSTLDVVEPDAQDAREGDVEASSDASDAGAPEPSVLVPGNLKERPCTRTYPLTGMQEGATGDPVANGTRLRAVLAATAPGDCITVAPGRYRLAGNVELSRPRVTLRGLGKDREATVFEHTTDNAALFKVTADDVEFFNFTHYVPGGLTRRSSRGESGEGNTWIAGGCKGFRAQDYLAWGSHDAAIFFYGAHHFTLNRVESRDSQSDAYHVSNGSSYGTWYDSVSRSSGDDGIGIVGYGASGPSTPHHHTIVRHSVFEQSPNGRGIGIIHVNNIRIYGPTLIEDSWGAGIILAREPHYGTGGIHDIAIEGEVRFRRCNKSPTIDHGAIHIHNPNSDAPIEKVTITGPLVMVDTGKNRPGGVSYQVRAHGAGRIQAVIGKASFYGVSPSTKLSLSLAAGSSVDTPGWSNATPVTPGPEPPFPLP